MSQHFCKNNLYFSSHLPWPAITRYLYLRNNAKKVTDNAGLYHYAGNNPVRYIDPDGNFFGSYYANEKFNETFKYFVDKYEKDLLELQNLNLNSNELIIPENKAFEISVTSDLRQADSFIGNDVKNFVQGYLGYEKNSESYRKYINDEQNRYKRLQKLRKSHNTDGSNNIKKVNDILNAAFDIFKEEQKSALEEGCSTNEINRRAEQKANNYIDSMLEKEGY